MILPYQAELWLVLKTTEQSCPSFCLEGKVSCKQRSRATVLSVEFPDPRSAGNGKWLCKTLSHSSVNIPV